jgi:hypothetical protein
LHPKGLYSTIAVIWVVISEELTKQFLRDLEEIVLGICEDYVSMDAMVIPFSDIAREQWDLQRGPGSGPELPRRKRPGLL